MAYPFIRTLALVLSVVAIAGHGVSIARVAAQSGNRLTLHLQAGPQPPADMPPGVVTIQVPLHPQAQPYQQTFVAPEYTMSGPCTKSAPQVIYLLPVDLDAALAWYQQAFSAAGYVFDQPTTGFSSNADTGESTRFAVLDFRARVDRHLDVQLTIQPSTDGSISAYNASDVTLPPRAPGSFVPANSTSVLVTYDFLNAPEGKHIVMKTVSTRTAIGRLVRAINALPRDSGAIRSCLLDYRSATLEFGQAGGNFVLVRVDSGCDTVTVEDYPALDGTPDLWTLLYAVAPPGVCTAPRPCPLAQPIQKR